jgi:hypothetical protein
MGGAEKMKVLDLFSGIGGFSRPSPVPPTWRNGAVSEKLAGCRKPRQFSTSLPLRSAVSTRTSPIVPARQRRSRKKKFEAEVERAVRTAVAAVEGTTAIR